uniref:KAT8 regulatory NSL complex subunit 3 n=1 Tax=Parasteatoda tepidariorum TaxID=114398 RepID=A0A2L2YK87_PARTP
MSFEIKYMSVEQYLRKVSGQEKETLIIDHNYVKPWNAHPDSHRTKPARLIFMKGLQRYPHPSYNINENEEIDIETCDEPITSPFDNMSTRKVIDELERNLQFSAHFSDVERKPEELDLDSCDPHQKKLYQQVIRIVNSDRLAKLTFRGTVDEPLKRRIATDKTSRQLRQMFGMVFWNIELLSWLHKKLLSSDVSIMISYVEILQTLRAKVPLLVDRILQACTGFAANDTVIQY